MNKLDNHSTTSGLRCPVCFTDKFSVSGDEWKCDGCHSSFPVFNGIPLLIRDTRSYLIQNYLGYRKYLFDEEKQIQNLIQRNSVDKSRGEIANRIVKALEHNHDLIKVFKQNLESCLEVEDLLKHNDSEQIQYLDNFDYVRRDWCFGEESEREIKTICHSLKNYIDDNIPSQNLCLALGCGTGRLAIELGKEFHEVYGIDNSFTMGSIFGELLKNDFSFYEINLRNAAKSSETVKKHTASLRDHNSISNFNYILADCLNMPLKSNIASCLLSIYFTDVVPINHLLNEAERLLSDNGLFVHFGPLQYHFRDYSYMMASDEIEALFYKQGFEIIHSSFIETDHYNSSLSMLSKTYKNWVFIARFIGNKNNSLAIGWNSILNANGSKFNISGAIREEETIVEAYEITSTTSEKVKVPEIIFTFLQQLDNQSTVKEILDRMGLFDGLELTDKENIFKTLRQLVNKSILTVKNEN